MLFQPTVRMGTDDVVQNNSGQSRVMMLFVLCDTNMLELCLFSKPVSSTKFLFI